MEKQPYVIPETVLLAMQALSRLLIETSGSEFSDLVEDDWGEL